jgi:DNA-binding transcriptional LysR family regulator
MPFPDVPFLATFVAVYELGGVTAAAPQLRRTQPTLSYQLAQLEHALGAPLFVRRGRQLVPTALGTQLHRLAVGFARELDLVRTGRAEGTLDVASVSVFGRYVLFPLIRKLDHVRIVLRFPTADEIFRRVADREIDLGFTHRWVSRPSLVLEPAHTEHLVLVASRGWARRLATPKQFRDVPVVTYDESDYVIGRWLGHHFGRRAPTWHSVAHFEEIEEVLALVADDTGVAIVPSAAIPRGAGLRTVAWGRPPAENTVFAVRRVGAAGQRVADELIARIRTLPPSAAAPR